MWTVEETQHKQMNGQLVFMDLRFVSLLFGISSIVIGIVLCTLNYQSPDKRYRQTAQFLVNSIFATCLISFIVWQTIWPEVYTLTLGMLFCAAGILIGAILYWIIQCGTTFIFTLTLGTFTGFCLANTMDMAFYYRYDFIDAENADVDSAVVLYPICIFFGILFAWIFNFNLYPYFLSFCGAFMIARGIVQLWIND